MENPIVRTFIHLSAAEQARADLLTAGVPEGDIEIRMLIYETGAVQGNFTVGDAPGVTGKTAYSHTYEPTAQDDVRDCMMTVNAADAALAGRVLEILERHGGFDPDPAARAAAREDARRHR